MLMPPLSQIPLPPPTPTTTGHHQAAPPIFAAHHEGRTPTIRLNCLNLAPPPAKWKPPPSSRNQPMREIDDVHPSSRNPSKRDIGDIGGPESTQPRLGTGLCHAGSRPDPRQIPWVTA
jgi:hypothetical protein